MSDYWNEYADYTDASADDDETIDLTATIREQLRDWREQYGKVATTQQQRAVSRQAHAEYLCGQLNVAGIPAKVNSSSSVVIELEGANPDIRVDIHMRLKSFNYTVYLWRGNQIVSGIYSSRSLADVTNEVARQYIRHKFIAPISAS